MYKANSELLDVVQSAPTEELKDKVGRLLRYLRRDGDIQALGICSCCHVLWYTINLTRSSYPIKGHPWENNTMAYSRMQKTNTMHMGYANKQRRKLARQLLNLFKQELRTRNES